MVDAEQTFLEALGADPDDDSRAVYTDWLEERGDPRAEYMRLEAEVHALGASATDFDVNQLERAAKSFDPGWRKIVTRPRVVKPPPAVAPPPTPASPPAPIPKSPAENANANLDWHTPSPMTPPFWARIPSPASESTGRWKVIALWIFIVVGAFLLVMPKKWTWVGVLEAFVALFDSSQMPKHPGRGY
jgi:uncharacterized protein (TIGR02996 family)